tara:strand:+ start:14481 stop:16271 length:1791 start_codon:yes stop_codon:yes gene_type:complete
MDEKAVFGKAILHLLHRNAMSREDLVRRTHGMKKETLDNKILGKSNTRASTRKAIIEVGLGADLEFFSRIEQAIAAGRDPGTVHRGNDGLDAVLKKILESVSGLTLPVARSIVQAFEEDAEEKSPGEIEQILRRKADEYQTLKLQIRVLKGDDPRVREFRQTSLKQIEAGRFEEAFETLRLAQRIDRGSRLDVEKSVIKRRKSETETLLSQAQLASLMSNYGEAVELCLEGHDVVQGLDQKLEDQSLRDAARYLDFDANDFGTPASESKHIARIEREILPFVHTSSREIRAEIGCYLADLYSLLGYRTGDKRALVHAAEIFRENLRQLPAQKAGAQYLDNSTRLGDAHVEIALLRSSVWQATLGVAILICGIEQSKAHVRSIEVATSMVRLGTAFANLGLLSNQLEHFEEATKAYEEAISLTDEKAEQLISAKAFWGLAIAYSDHGSRIGSVDMLKRSEQACEKAMSYHTRDRFPVDWATLMTNRGNARLERGKLENGVETLREAISDYDAALDIRTRSRFLLGFVRSRGNRAIAERVIAERTGDSALAQRSIDDLKLVVSLSKENSYWRKYYFEELEQAEVVAGELNATGDNEQK